MCAGFQKYGLAWLCAGRIGCFFGMACSVAAFKQEAFAPQATIERLPGIDGVGDAENPPDDVVRWNDVVAKLAEAFGNYETAWLCFLRCVCHTGIRQWNLDCVARQGHDALDEYLMPAADGKGHEVASFWGARANAVLAEPLWHRCLPSVGHAVDHDAVAFNQVEVEAVVRHFVLRHHHASHAHEHSYGHHGWQYGKAQEGFPPLPEERFSHFAEVAFDGDHEMDDCVAL